MNVPPTSYQKLYGQGNILRDTSESRQWKSSRGFDRKGHTMRNPPASGEQRNWLTEQFYDLMTVTNVASTGYESEADFENKRTIMRACVSRLGDKAIPTESRINALDIVASLLMNSRSKELLGNQNEELFDAIISTFSKSSTPEDELFRGLRVLGLLALHEGLDSDTYVRKLLQYIGGMPDHYYSEGTRQVNYKSEPPVEPRPAESYTHESVRCQAMATMAIATFFCANDEDLIVRVLDIVESILCRPVNATSITEDGPQGSNETCTDITEPMRGAAADCWCIIAMRLEPTLVMSRVQMRVMHALRNLLFSNNLDTRVAGGEAIAFLYELAQDTAEADETAELWLSPDGDIWDDIIDQLDFLSGEYDRRMSRRERREQHKMFRAFHKTLTEGQYPLEVLKLPDCQLSVETWGGVKILDIIRLFMGRGFHEGLYHIPAVQDVLGMPDWMRKVVSRERTIEDEQLDKRRVADRKVWIDDGSHLPNARASRKFQSRKKEHRHRTGFASEVFSREYDMGQMPGESS